MDKGRIRDLKRKRKEAHPAKNGSKVTSDLSSTFAQKVCQLKGHFPSLASFALDLLNINSDSCKMTPNHIPHAFFTLIRKYESSLRGIVASLEHTNPAKAPLLSTYLACQIREISLYGTLHGFWDGDLEQKFQSSLVMLLRHYVNSSLLTKSHEDVENPEESAVRLYRFVKSIFSGDKNQASRAQGILDTFLLSKVTDPGHENRGLYGCLLLEILGDFRNPYLISSATSILKFLVLLRIYFSEQGQRLNEVDESSSNFAEALSFLHDVNLTEFDDIARAKELCKCFGKSDIQTLYKRIKVARTVGLLNKLVYASFGEQSQLEDMKQGRKGSFPGANPNYTLDLDAESFTHKMEKEPNNRGKLNGQDFLEIDGVAGSLVTEKVNGVHKVSEDIAANGNNDQFSASSKVNFSLRETVSFQDEIVELAAREDDESEDLMEEMDEDEGSKLNGALIPADPVEKKSIKGFTGLRVGGEGDDLGYKPKMATTSEATVSFFPDDDEAVEVAEMYDDDDEIAVCATVTAAVPLQVLGAEDKDEAEADPVEDAKFKRLMHKVRTRRNTADLELSSDSEEEDEEDDVD